MTMTLDTSDARATPGKTSGLFTRIARALLAYRAHRMRQRVLFDLVLHDAHLLRHMGIDPRDLDDAINRRSHSPLFYPIRSSDAR